jgi:hypothetical protein
MHRNLNQLFLSNPRILEKVSTGASLHLHELDPESWSHAGEKVLFNHIYKENIIQISIKYVHIYVYRYTREKQIRRRYTEI